MSAISFRLKEYLCGTAAASAEVSLGGSYVEPYTLQQLAQLEPMLPESLMETSMHYPGTEGSPPVKQAVAKRYGLTQQQVLLTEGADGAIQSLFRALFDSNSKVVVQVPCYEPLKAIAEELKANVIPWHSEERANWSPDLNRLEAHFKNGANAVLINVPHNPSGWMPDEDFCQQLLELCLTYNVLLVADEIYLGLPFNKPFKPFATRWDKAISIGGLSKAFGMPALRVGWIATQNQQVLDQVRVSRTYGNAFISGLSETVALALLKHADQVLIHNSAQRQSGFELMQQFVHSNSNIISWLEGQGGVTGFFRLRDDLSASKFAADLLNSHKTLVVPATLFDAGDHHLRLGFGHASLAAGLERLDDFLQVYANG